MIKLEYDVGIYYLKICDGFTIKKQLEYMSKTL